MFSEIDAAKWLLKGAISGRYDEIEYLPKQKTVKSPDFMAYRNNRRQKFAVEVKMLSPQDNNENKFVLRVISKINRKAIPQLKECYNSEKFDEGIILIWSYKQISLENINYQDINRKLGQSIKKSSFPVGIYVTLYRKGIWDFHLAPQIYAEK